LKQRKAKQSQLTSKKELHHHLKYAAVIALGIGITAAIGYPVYQNQIESQTVCRNCRSEKSKC
jgi:hypothetical protein